MYARTHARTHTLHLHIVLETLQDIFLKMLVPISWKSVQNWRSSAEKTHLIRKVMTPLTFDPQPLRRVLTLWCSAAYHRIGYIIPHILALVSCRSDKNWRRYRQKSFLTFSRPWPWPLTRSLPKPNRLVLRSSPIIPPNFMKFGPVLFELFDTHTHTHPHTRQSTH